MDFDIQVKLAVYRHFAETGRRPSPGEVAGRVGSDVESVLDAYGRLRAQRVLVLEADGSSIRMAPPFSGVPTQHVVEAGGIRVLRQLRLGRAGSAGGAAQARHGSLPLRAIRRASSPGGGPRGTGALGLALPLPRPGGEVVGRHRLHLKQHALLPVGRTSSRVVRGARIPDATAGEDRPALDARDDLVFDSTAGEFPAPSAGRDARDLRRPGPGGRLLGSEIG